MNPENLIQFKYDLLSNIFDITFMVDGHYRLAKATTNEEMIIRLGGSKEDVNFSDDSKLEFYDFNEAKWWNINVENIVEINQYKSIT